jgi:hypothetical protein
MIKLNVDNAVNETYNYVYDFIVWYGTKYKQHYAYIKIDECYFITCKNSEIYIEYNRQWDDAKYPDRIFTLYICNAIDCTRTEEEIKAMTRYFLEVTIYSLGTACIDSIGDENGKAWNLDKQLMTQCVLCKA